MDYTARLEMMYLDALAEGASSPIERAFYALKTKGAELMATLHEKRLTVRIPADLHKAFKQICVGREIDMSDTIVNMIRAFVLDADAQHDGAAGDAAAPRQS